MDTKKLLDQLVGSGFAGGLAGGALAGLVTGTKTGRKMAGSAMKLGGLALVAGVAYKAWQAYQDGGQQGSRAGNPARAGAAPQMPPADSGFLPPGEDSAGTDALALLLARAMIAAAKADGQIDAAESQKILDHINGLDLPAEDKAFLFEEYTHPLDIGRLAAAVTTPQQATEVYAASVLMVEPPSAAERIYLDGLASALTLDAGLAAEIRAAAADSRNAGVA